MSTIQTINASDLITNSRATINTNFSNLNTDKIETSVLDTDGTLVANSDSKVATQKAVKTYVGTSLVQALLASDFSDGDVTISSNTSLTRDMYYEDLTVTNSATLTTAGYRIFAKTVTINAGAKINNSGGAGGNGTGGTGGTAGAAAAAGTMPGGLAGKIGGAGSGSGAGAGGTAGTNSTYNMNSNAGAGGGAGGAGPSGAGGAGSSGGTNTSTINPPRNIISAFYLFDFTSTTAVQRYLVNSGSGSGGGGGFGNPGTGGGGGGSGGSGGCVFIAAETITNAGSIWAKGGDGGAGANGAQDAGGGGGGGGGNGGIVFLVYSSLTNNGSISAAGGALGAKGLKSSANGADGVNGVVGYDGLVIQMTR